MKCTMQELGSFCHQFDLSTKKPSCNGNCSHPKKYSSQRPPYKRSPHKNQQQFYSKPDQPYYKKPYKFTKPHKPFQSKPKTKFDPKNITCYKCNQKGHTSRFCKVNTKLHELQIDEDTINQIQNLYIEATDIYIYIYIWDKLSSLIIALSSLLIKFNERNIVSVMTLRNMTLTIIRSLGTKS